MVYNLHLLKNAKFYLVLYQDIAFEEELANTIHHLKMKLKNHFCNNGMAGVDLKEIV